MGDLVFVAPCNGVVHAVEKATGRARWTYDARQDGGRPEFHGDPLVTEELIVFGSDVRRPGGTGHVYALERATGQPRWKYRTELGVMTDVVRDGERLYAVTLNDELICLDLASGRLNWSFRSGFLNKEIINILTTPALGAGRLFFGGHDGIVHALEARAGRPQWQRNLGSPVWTPLTLLADGLYLGTRDGRIHRLSPDAGDVLAEGRAGGIPVGPVTPAAGSLLILADDDGQGATLKSLDPALNGVRWARDPKEGRWTSCRPYLWQGSVLAGSERGELASLSIADGSLNWSSMFSGAIRGIGSDEDAVYVGTLNGTLYAYVPPGPRAVRH